VNKNWRPNRRDPKAAADAEKALRDHDFQGISAIS